jgi:hypothetical protein
MKRIIIYTFILLIIGTACKKSFDAEPTFANYPLAANWAKGTPFYSPTSQRFDDATGVWRNFSAFSFTSEAEPDKIGFGNPFVAGKGTNALDFNRLYVAQNLTSDSGFYNVTIPKCFQLIPKSADSLQSGTVLVLAQSINLTRRDRTTFDIKISPAANLGTYDTRTGLLEVAVKFDERSINGDSAVIRRYRFTP